MLKSIENRGEKMRVMKPNAQPKPQKAIFPLLPPLFFTLITATAGWMPGWAWSEPLHPARMHQPGRWASSLGLDYFRSNANFDNDWGSFERLPAGGYYQNFLFRYQTQYDLSPHWSLKGSLGLATAQSFDGTFSRRNGEFTEAGVGTGLAWMFPLFEVFPEIWLHYPFQRVAFNTDETLVGEGAMLLTPSLWFRVDFRPWLKPIGRVGWRYRDEGRSSLLLWDLGAHLHFGAWTHRIFLSGQHSVTDDDFVMTPNVRNQVTQNVSGSSMRYFSVNPSLLELQLRFDYALSPDLFVGAGGVYTLDGVNSAQGYSLLAHLSWDIHRKKPTRGSGPAQRHQQDPRRFQADPAGYDDRLFQPPPSPELEEQRRREQILRQRRQQQLEEQRQRLRSRPPQASDEEVDQLLRQTEEELR